MSETDAQYGGYIAGAIGILTAVGAFVMQFIKQKQAEQEASDGRADRVSKEFVEDLKQRLTKVEGKEEDCERKYTEACSRIGAVEEKARRCEEDREQLNERVNSLEQCKP